MFKSYRKAYRKDKSLRSRLWYHKYLVKWYGRCDNEEKEIKKQTEQLIYYQNQRRQMKLLYRKLGHKGYVQHQKKLQEDLENASDSEVEEEILSEEQLNLTKIIQQKQLLNTPQEIVKDEVTGIQYKNVYKVLAVSAYNNKELVVLKDQDETVQTQQMESQKKKIIQSPNKIYPKAQLNEQPANKNKKFEKLRTSLQKSQRLLKLQIRYDILQQVQDFKMGDFYDNDIYQ
eukprot:403359752